ncbi:unnamed protein product [Dimorphilus gyrociliatus]|uniref:C2H2-type domain-containing protein n=1 Tax=Dimorphilus gyrociliatus TaxID=2664684 RepID=A0A7I8VSU3_9ANNE|nr:unnamed protein product [Dimorphilus gyrociliatus]
MKNNNVPINNDRLRNPLQSSVRHQSQSHVSTPVFRKEVIVIKPKPELLRSDVQHTAIEPPKQVQNTSRIPRKESQPRQKEPEQHSKETNNRVEVAVNVSQPCNLSKTSKTSRTNVQRIPNRPADFEKRPINIPLEEVSQTTSFTEPRDPRRRVQESHKSTENLRDNSKEIPTGQKESEKRPRETSKRSELMRNIQKTFAEPIDPRKFIQNTSRKTEMLRVDPKLVQSRQGAPNKTLGVSKTNLQQTSISQKEPQESADQSDKQVATPEKDTQQISTERERPENTAAASDSNLEVSGQKPQQTTTQSSTPVSAVPEGLKNLPKNLSPSKIDMKQKRLENSIEKIGRKVTSCLKEGQVAKAKKPSLADELNKEVNTITKQTLLKVKKEKSILGVLVASPSKTAEQRTEQSKELGAKVVQSSSVKCRYCSIFLKNIDELKDHFHFTHNVTHTAIDGLLAKMHNTQLSEIDTDNEKESTATSKAKDMMKSIESEEISTSDKGIASNAENYHQTESLERSILDRPAAEFETHDPNRSTLDTEKQDKGESVVLNNQRTKSSIEVKQTSANSEIKNNTTSEKSVDSDCNPRNNTTNINKLIETANNIDSEKGIVNEEQHVSSTFNSNNSLSGAELPTTYLSEKDVESAIQKRSRVKNTESEIVMEQDIEIQKQANARNTESEIVTEQGLEIQKRKRIKNTESDIVTEQYVDLETQHTNKNTESEQDIEIQKQVVSSTNECNDKPLATANDEPSETQTNEPKLISDCTTNKQQAASDTFSSISDMDHEQSTATTVDSNNLISGIEQKDKSKSAEPDTETREQIENATCTNNATREKDVASDASKVGEVAVIDKKVSSEVENQNDINDGTLDIEKQSENNSLESEMSKVSEKESVSKVDEQVSEPKETFKNKENVRNVVGDENQLKTFTLEKGAANKDTISDLMNSKTEESDDRIFSTSEENVSHNLEKNTSDSKLEQNKECNENPIDSEDNDESERKRYPKKLQKYLSAQNVHDFGMDKLLEMKLIDGNNIKCQYCGTVIALSEKEGLKNHIYNHLHETPLCNRNIERDRKLNSFCKLTEQLADHVVGMTCKTSAWRCVFDGCTYFTYRSEDLSDHLKSHHEKINKYICYLCKKSVESLSLLIDHLKVVANYICKECNFTDCDKIIVKNHIKENHKMDVEIIEKFNLLSCQKVTNEKTDKILNKVTNPEVIQEEDVREADNTPCSSPYAPLIIDEDNDETFTETSKTDDNTPEKLSELNGSKAEIDKNTNVMNTLETFSTANDPLLHDSDNFDDCDDTEENQSHCEKDDDSMNIQNLSGSNRKHSKAQILDITLNLKETIEEFKKAVPLLTNTFSFNGNSLQIMHYKERQVQSSRPCHGESSLRCLFCKKTFLFGIKQFSKHLLSEELYEIRESPYILFKCKEKCEVYNNDPMEICKHNKIFHSGGNLVKPVLMSLLSEKKQKPIVEAPVEIINSSDDAKEISPTNDSKDDDDAYCIEKHEPESQCETTVICGHCEFSIEAEDENRYFKMRQHVIQGHLPKPFYCCKKGCDFSADNYFQIETHFVSCHIYITLEEMQRKYVTEEVSNVGTDRIIQFSLRALSLKRSSVGKGSVSKRRRLSALVESRDEEDDEYRCSICFAKLTDVTKIEAHIRDHFEYNRYECLFCLKKYKNLLMETVEHASQHKSTLISCFVEINNRKVNALVKKFAKELLNCRGIIFKYPKCLLCNIGFPDGVRAAKIHLNTFHRLNPVVKIDRSCIK